MHRRAAQLGEHVGRARPRAGRTRAPARAARRRSRSDADVAERRAAASTRTGIAAASCASPSSSSGITRAAGAEPPATAAARRRSRASRRPARARRRASSRRASRSRDDRVDALAHHLGRARREQLRAAESDQPRRRRRSRGSARRPTRRARPRRRACGRAPRPPAPARAPPRPPASRSAGEQQLARGACRGGAPTSTARRVRVGDDVAQSRRAPSLQPVERGDEPPDSLRADRVDALGRARPAPGRRRRPPARGAAPACGSRAERAQHADAGDGDELGAHAAHRRSRSGPPTIGPAHRGVDRRALPAIGEGRRLGWTRGRLRRHGAKRQLRAVFDGPRTAACDARGGRERSGARYRPPSGAPVRLHRGQAHRAARAADRRHSPSSTWIAAARSPGTVPASWSAIRSCGSPTRSTSSPTCADSRAAHRRARRVRDRRGARRRTQRRLDRAPGRRRRQDRGDRHPGRRGRHDARLRPQLQQRVRGLPRDRRLRHPRCRRHHHQPRARPHGHPDRRRRAVIDVASRRPSPPSLATPTGVPA